MSEDEFFKTADVVKLDTLSDVNDIGKPWRYEEDGLTVTRTSPWSPPGCQLVGCGLKLYVDEAGKLVKVEGDENNPVTQSGHSCYTPRLGAIAYIAGTTYPEWDYAGVLPGRWEDERFDMTEVLVVSGCIAAFGSSAIGFVYDATGRFDLSFYAGIGILALCAILVIVAVSQKKKIRETVWIEADEEPSAQLHVVDRPVEQVDHHQPVADLAG